MISDSDRSEDWTGWAFSTCSLMGHPAEPHWHPPVGQHPAGAEEHLREHRHVETMDDPLGEGPICRGCLEDWPCPYVQGFRAARRLIEDPAPSEGGEGRT